MTRLPTHPAHTLQRSPLRRLVRPLVTSLLVAALGACSMLQPKATAPPAFYALDFVPPTVIQPTQSAPTTGLLTLVVSPVRAASGFDSQRIIYMREPHKLEYFARSEWVDTPARMLGPLLVASLAHTGAFQAVLLAPGSASADLRLDTEIVRLQQEFHTSPSSVHFTLRVNLVDEKTRRVVAWQEFDSKTDARGDNAQAGVVAANAAVHTVLNALAPFVVGKLQLMRMAPTPNRPINPITIK